MSLNRFGLGILFASTLAMSACGYSEKKFKNDYLAAYCDQSVACAGEGGTGLLFEDASECETFLGAFFGLGTAGCDYDSKAGKACIEEIDAAACDSLNDTPSCNDVYSGDACGWGGSTTTTGTTFTTTF